MKKYKKPIHKKNKSFKFKFILFLIILTITGGIYLKYNTPHSVNKVFGNIRYEHDEDGYFVIDNNNVCIDYILNLPDHIRFNNDDFKGGDRITVELKKVRKNMQLQRESFAYMKDEIVKVRKGIEERNRRNGNYDPEDFDVLIENEQKISEKMDRDNALYDKTDELLESGIEMQKGVNEFRYEMKEADNK